jgi:hypothetical protein
MMKKLLVIGTSLIIMGFVACSQSNQPTSDVNATSKVLETTASKNDDLDTVDFETSSTSENIDDDTKGKLKKPKARFNHKFSNGSMIALINSTSGETLLRTAHSQIVSQTKNLPDFISEHEKKIKSAGLNAKAVSIYPSGSVGAPWFGQIPYVGEIPYIIDPVFSSSELAVISRAIELWNENINAKYVPHSGQWDVVRFRRPDSGSGVCQASYTGKGPWLVSTYISNLQTIQLGDCASILSSVLHEMAHTAGLYHEQQRCDRDSFIKQSQVPSEVGATLNFGKLCFPLAQDVEPFDYSSTMAYAYKTYRVPGGSWVINVEPLLSAPTGNYIGDWTNLGLESRTSNPLGITQPFLSQADVIALNRLYPVGTNAPMGALAGLFAGEAHSANVGWQSWVAASDGNKLWWRDAVGTLSPWQQIGIANGIVGLAAANGKLFAATSENKLWWRDAVATATWQQIGFADKIVALAATNGKLYAATSEDKLWWRDAVATATWQQIDTAYSIVGLAATNGKLFAVTADNKLWWRNAVGTVSPWQQIDTAYQIVSMTALNNKLYVATSDNKLWWRDAVGTTAPWQQIDTVNGAAGLAAWNGKLFVATTPEFEIGTAGQGLQAIRLSTYRIRKSMMIGYQVYVPTIGWQNYRTNGELAGTTGASLDIQAVRVSLYGDRAGCSITYRTKAKNGIWSAHSSESNTSGSAGSGVPLEKLAVRISCI